MAGMEAATVAAARCSSLHSSGLHPWSEIFLSVNDNVSNK